MEMNVCFYPDYIDPKFENSKCWSYVLFRAPQALAASAEGASI